MRMNILDMIGNDKYKKGGMDKNERYQNGKRIVIMENGWTFVKFKSLLSKCLTDPIYITDRVWCNCYQTYVYSSFEKFIHPVDWAKHYFRLYDKSIDMVALKPSLHHYYHVEGALYINEDEFSIDINDYSRLS
jgi:hypothetical protein